MRIPSDSFRALDLEVHSLLSGITLHDVSVIDLPGGGSSRTMEDVRILMSSEVLTSTNLLVRGLFRFRRLLGYFFGWDSCEHSEQQSSYIHRLNDDLKARAAVLPGTTDGLFTVLYVLERESVMEARNSIAHAFLCSALESTTSGYRLYWGVYVEPLSRLTPLYLATIEPFRRFVIYPAVFRKIRRSWADRYCKQATTCNHFTD